MSWAAWYEPFSCTVGPSVASQAMAENMALNDACIGIDAFLSKSKPVWTGT